MTFAQRDTYIITNFCCSQYCAQYCAHSNIHVSRDTLPYIIVPSHTLQKYSVQQAPNMLAAHLPSVAKPSSLHTTLASGGPQSSSHTVPQTPSRHTSTLPSRSVVPFTSRTDPSTHTLPPGPGRQNDVYIYIYTLCSQVAECRGFDSHPG